MILNAFFLAFRQIQRNFLRAILTMLGIIIGVCSVIVMISLGNGTTESITKNLSSLGSNTLFIVPSRSIGANTTSSERRKFSLNEFEALKAQTMGFVNLIAPVMHTNALVQYRDNNILTEIYGVEPEYFIIENWQIAQGRIFREDELKAGSNSCILGATVHNTLFGNESPLGNRIKVGSITCECVGVFAAKGQSMGSDSDNGIFMPPKAYRTSIEKSDNLYNIKQIMVSLHDGIDSVQASETISTLFRAIRGVRKGQKDNFDIHDTRQILETIQQTTSRMTMFVGAIAGVSLIVGGIGIMNIMLVSVTERTKEIGTRLAIGALQKEVLLQFLIESLTLSALGGLIGIVLAFFIAWFVSRIWLDIPFVFNWGIASIAFLFSGAIGVVFGYLPARRASRLNPIEALRHE
ncbi:MAG: ABC transporter permease [Helicobacter sp.]|nr:ABC transporter permease [Helicobacter sp.]